LDEYRKPYENGWKNASLPERKRTTSDGVRITVNLDTIKARALRGLSVVWPHRKLFPFPEILSRGRSFV
jgi:hypothetical protein